MNYVQVRVARPTNNLQEIIRFYGRGLGLKQIAQFQDHEGFDGVMFGIPDASYHLEFTQHIDGSPCPAPTKDNLLVFYIPSKGEIQRLHSHLTTMGYKAVEPENPYWNESGVTIEDPDGWRIVLMCTKGI
ncbi:VOC family protein [Peribacillus frigoritolerans]|uniref:VOC family protein n=1 Tax=Peribacillus frigoritolerans TaxID=450367 RepID=UPI00105A0FBC|nr:VOC family protein [Peribacillus frigoritolerans]TDL82444.1 VOC family protein [Peribacillus frigoritolerans]